MNDDQRSLEYVREAVSSLPGALRSALDVPLPTLRSQPRTIVTTGIGASEGPARALAALLVEGGIAARFCATSSFVGDAPRADLLIQFSQGLSPNARMMLHDKGCATQRWLVTSVDPARAPDTACAQLQRFDDGGFVPIIAPPASEPSTLVRLIGPTVATLMAMRLAAHILQDGALAALLQHAPEAYRSIVTGHLIGDEPLALVTVGVSSELAYSHRWKLLEAILRNDPPVWDVLQFAHGPLQAFYDKPLTLVILERGHGSPLVERLVSTLQPEHHRVLRLSSRHDDVLCFFEHTASIDALFLAQLEQSPKNLFDWPARFEDAPLYGLGLPIRAREP